MEYDATARARLGRAIRAARVQAGYASRAPFAELMNRSTRQVQALEKGEAGVGPDTWAAAAAALGWPLERIYELLDGVAVGDGVGGDTQDADYVAAPGEIVDQAVSNDQVLAELRRMREDYDVFRGEVREDFQHLSRRVARLESSAESVGGVDGQT